MIKLTAQVLDAIRQHSPEIISKLSIALNVSDRTIKRYIRDNSDNLTKAAAIITIREVTGLPVKLMLVEDDN